MIWSNLIIISNRKFEKLTFSTKSDSESTKSIRVRTVKTKGYSKSSFPLINREDYEILYGLLLGDLFISRKNNENALIRFEQSIIHREYLEHLFEIFKYLGTAKVSVKTAERKAFNTSSFYFTTRQLTAITELHKLFYNEGKKIVPLNIGSLLTERSLAYWVAFSNLLRERWMMVISVSWQTFYNYIFVVGDSSFFGFLYGLGYCKQ